NVGPLYLDEFISIVKPVVGTITSFTFPAGEQQKKLDTVKSLYEHLILEHFDRKDMLIALGGGVVGDLTGYTAATYLRGIDFIQVPTTLLSCVDSSIGGKTGVDFHGYKNMIGAFHQPKLVYISLPVLRSLGEDEFACGMGEILKHGLIKDAKYYEWLIEHMSEIEDRDTEVMTSMILKSCKIKRRVVEKDPMEQGERALLNFGHTIGHAIEKLLNGTMLHGQCVALGSVAAAYISYKRKYLSTEEFYEIRDMNVGFNLPISIDGLLAEDILHVTKSDKKMDAGQIKFVLLKSLGEAMVDTTVTDQELLEAISFLIEGDKGE
ncbi:MAG TPA: 3-dehydroquinate synthase, partial [Candidatus Merdenecus merdavium]|nr:3-dehydroquinate synthase [Candidatus Merdenecus merdavium]